MAHSSAKLLSFGGFLFLCHTLIEIGLGAIKLRGKYAGIEMPIGSEKFARHHGVSLLSLALLGGLVLLRRSWHKEEGALASIVLCFFHAGCCIIKPALTVMLMHGTLALGFGLYSLQHRAAGLRVD